MELSSVKNSQLQGSTQAKKADVNEVQQNVKKANGDTTATPVKTDSVTLSAESIAANEAEVAAFHGGGVYVPPKKNEN
jgi:hypothetical protein